jgi:hypothetical protein
MMTKETQTKYICDGCEREYQGSHGLPLGWFALTRQTDIHGKKSQVHWHFCSPECLRKGTALEEE